MENFDLVPKWESILPLLLDRLSPEQDDITKRDGATKMLIRMAEVADAYVAMHIDPQLHDDLASTWEAVLSINLMPLRLGVEELTRMARAADRAVAKVLFVV
jgi:hypothetical protein